MWSKSWGMLAVFLLAAACQGAEPLNVDVTIGWDGAYRPQEWTPVQVDVFTKRKDAFGGWLSVKGKQDGLTQLGIDHPIVIQPEIPLHLPLVTKLIPGGGSCDVSITDDRGREQWSTQVGLQAYYGDSRAPLPLEPKDMLIGLVGRRTAGLAELGKQAGCQSDEGKGAVYVKDKLTHGLPWDWTGYASLDLLLLYNSDWEAINAQQAKAIRDWVTNGGSVLFVLGGRAPPTAGPLAELLPVKIGAMRRLSLRSRDLPFRGVRADANGVTAWTLEELRDPGWSVERFGGEAVLAHGQLGFGRAGVLAFDPAELAWNSSENTAVLWDWATKGLLDRRKLQVGKAPEADNSQTPGMGGGYSRGYPGGYYPGGRSRTASDQALGAVMEHLFQIPELRPLSIWWVIGLLAILAVLLGPLDYFILKKLDRLPLTWVTSAVLIALFTAGAYYGVQALRAGSTQVRAVTVTDAIDNGPAWSTSYSGIFASASDDYRLEGLAAGQWWSGLSPTSEADYDGYGGSSEISTRRIYCHQQDGASLPYSLPISIWSMQCLLTERPVDKAPISADVTVRGDRISVNLTNRSEGRIRAAWIMYGTQEAMLGEVPAKATARLEKDLGPSTSGRGAVPLDDSIPNVGPGLWSASTSIGTVQRGSAFQSYLKRGAAVICAVYEDSPACCRVAGATHSTTHTELVRLVVFPKKGGTP